MGFIVLRRKPLHQKQLYQPNSMEGQSQGTMQISEAMVQLSESSSQTTTSLTEVNGAIAQLNEAAQSLRDEVSRFQFDNY
ncbi:hypothetical protein [Allocoleopsis sp.]|uniref:hypothetical protein n=1 Tax=Allocoleopsis sp. TaxID=3088169 RepID=UPI002FD6B573